MAKGTGSLAALVLAIWTVVAAEPELPRADDVSWPELRGHIVQLRQALQSLKTPLAAEMGGPLDALLKDEPKDPTARAARVQGILDLHCLIGVTINPESRVKAAPGPAAAKLPLDREVFLLIKVHNQAGVTNALKVAGPQLRTPGQTGEGH